MHCAQGSKTTQTMSTSIHSTPLQLELRQNLPPLQSLAISPPPPSGLTAGCASQSVSQLILPSVSISKFHSCPCACPSHAHLAMGPAVLASGNVKRSVRDAHGVFKASLYGLGFEMCLFLGLCFSVAFRARQAPRKSCAMNSKQIRTPRSTRAMETKKVMR
jgi:hypothetical protein